jgi:Chalcone isomerase-like
MSLKTTASLTLGACALACMPVYASFEPADLQQAAPVQVAGQRLRLNGGGVGSRLMFKVYAMGLYLPDRRGSLQEIAHRDEPRRLVIRLLRDLDGERFNGMLMDYAQRKGAALSPQVIGPLMQLARLIASQPRGLRTGDVLTFDWVPGTGTLVTLNNLAVTDPLRGAQLYLALLDIWLGEQPADPALKSQLLGQGESPPGRTYH